MAWTLCKVVDIGAIAAEVTPASRPPPSSHITPATPLLCTSQTNSSPPPASRASYPTSLLKTASPSLVDFLTAPINKSLHHFRLKRCPFISKQQQSAQGSQTSCQGLRITILKPHVLLKFERRSVPFISNLSCRGITFKK